MGFLKKMGNSIKNPKQAASVVFNKVDEGAGKKIFGNTSGVVKSMSGRSKLDNSINSELKENNPELFHLKKHGFTKYENSYDELMISEIGEKFNKLIEDKKTSFPTSGYEGKIYQRAIKDPEKCFPEITKLITQDVREFVAGYYKTSYKIKYILCVKNYSVPKEIQEKNEMFSNHWHMDKHNASWLKFFVYLSDVSEKDGPFHIQSKHRTKELVKMGYGNRDHYDLSLDILENPEFVNVMTGPNGTTMFGDVATCLHRAGIPEEGHYRNMVQIFFEPTDKPFTDDWINDVEEYTDLKYYDPETDSKHPITELNKNI
jgi:hypothetical protein